MARAKLMMADRTREMGSIRLSPGTFLGMVELGDGVTPEYLTRVLDEKLCLVVEAKEPAKKESKSARKAVVIDE